MRAIKNWFSILWAAFTFTVAYLIGFIVAYVTVTFVLQLLLGMSGNKKGSK